MFYSLSAKTEIALEIIMFVTVITIAETELTNLKTLIFVQLAKQTSFDDTDESEANCPCADDESRSSVAGPLGWIEVY